MKLYAATFKTTVVIASEDWPSKRAQLDCALEEIKSNGAAALELCECAEISENNIPHGWEISIPWHAPNPWEPVKVQRTVKQILEDSK